MAMDVTIGYGSAAPRDKRRPVFVVRGSEELAALADEGWSEVEHGFFVTGTLLEQQPARTPAASVFARHWRWVAVSGAALVLSASAVLIAAAPRKPLIYQGVAAAPADLPGR
jgi:hypothetical protein